MQLKTMQELKEVCQIIPYFVGAAVLFTFAHETIIPPPFFVPLKSLILAISGTLLILSGFGIAILDGFIISRKDN